MKLRQKLSEKFQDYEAVPQDDSWEKIRFALDLKEKLGTYEAEPKAESWEKISLATNLTEKFGSFEAEPQAESWNKILLATQLPNKFSNYEAEPKAESWEIIKAAIQKDKRRPVVILPIFYRVGIAASIALLLGFGWLLSRNSSNENTDLASNKNSQKTIKNVKSGEKLKIETPDNQPVIAKKDEVLPEKDFSNKNISEENLAKNNFEEKPKFTLNQNRIKRQNNNFDNLRKKEIFAQNKERIFKQKEKNNIPITIDNNKTVEENSIAENQKSVSPKTEPNDKTLTISFLSSKSFKPRTIRKPFDAIVYNNEKPMMEQEVRVRRKLILTTSLMPLQAYQALTILPQTNSYVQQVGTLNALDAQRLGVQLKVGVMKPVSNRFSTGASFTYSGIRQRVSYDVNNGNYEIQTVDSQNYTLVGLNESVSQSKFLQTVGVKIDNSFLVANRRNKVYVLGGGEAVRVLNDKQYAYYINASVGVSYPTKNNKSIWIEPTFRYSLSQSFDANSYLQIRPYNIGLNVRVNFM